MASPEKQKVIPAEYIPEKGSHVETIDGKDYLITNDAMYTFYKRTKGEFSPFFLALRDEKKLLGCKCSQCGLVRVPPFLTHCPDCNFAPTELIDYLFCHLPVPAYGTLWQGSSHIQGGGYGHERPPLYHHRHPGARGY